MSILFLDIDGVLNNGELDEKAKSCIIHPWNVSVLNTILDKCKPKVVISSAWRYMVLNEAMTHQGFKYLLQTHRIHADYLKPDQHWAYSDEINNLHVLSRDEFCTNCFHTSTNYEKCDQCGTIQSRARLIQNYLDIHGREKYCIVDNDDLGFTEMGLTFVQTDGKIGITYENAELIINHLT